MIMSIKIYARTALQILHRDMLVLKRTIRGAIINASCTSFMFFIIYGHVLPTLGMPAQLIGPSFLGSFANLLLLFGFSTAVTLLFEIKNKGRLFYLLTLPLPPLWLFGTFIISFMVQATIIVVPPMLFGILMLSDSFHVIHRNWYAGICVYLLTILFFALFMTISAVHYTSTWFFDNLWPRRLTPMFCFGCAIFVWKAVYTHAPYAAMLMLLNPLVYCIEGLRSSFIGGDMFIPAWICITMLSIYCTIEILLLAKSIYKRLDPV